MGARDARVEGGCAVGGCDVKGMPPLSKTFLDTPMILTLPTQMDDKSLSTFMTTWPSDPVNITVVFNKKQWSTPTGMVGLACLIDKHQKKGGSVELNFEQCEGTGYWERMGFFREIGLPAPVCANGIARPASGRFAELRKIGDIEEVDNVTQELVSATHTSAQGLKTFSHILSEAMNNVCQHSGAYGFSAAQYWEYNGRVEFCIADTGQGLLSALTPSHTPSDDADAIRLALKVGVTSRSPYFNQRQMRNRGVGLSCIERLVRANGGRFQVWSGHGRFANENDAPYLTSDSWIGTLISVNMKRDELTADFHNVMQQMAEELRLAEAEKKVAR